MHQVLNSFCFTTSSRLRFVFPGHRMPCLCPRDFRKFHSCSAAIRGFCLLVARILDDWALVKCLATRKGLSDHPRLPLGSKALSTFEVRLISKHGCDLSSVPAAPSSSEAVRQSIAQLHLFLQSWRYLSKEKCKCWHQTVRFLPDLALRDQNLCRRVSCLPRPTRGRVS